jgi:GDPmannose 4,6-dehydratase
MPTALILGVASQDGSYLAEFLLAKKYQVFGSVRPEGDDLHNIAGFKNRICLISVDLSQPESITAAIRKYHPDEFYHLAAMTVPAQSWDQAYLVGQVTGLSPVVSLEAIRKFSPHTRFFYPASSAIYHPQNPYAAAKTYAFYMTRIYREAHHLFAVNGILFNHESSRRPLDFATHKITSYVAAVKTKQPGTPPYLVLWDLDSRRDWGFAGDYVRAMWVMLQAPVPKDYVIATGKLHSVREVCEIAFSSVDLKWQKYVQIDPSRRPGPDTGAIAGNISEIKKDLGWSPKTSFKELIKMMVLSDLALLS